MLALNAASGYVGAFIRASNQQYEVDEGRGFFKLRPLQIGVTLVMILLLIAAAVAVIVTGPLAEAVGNAIGAGSTAFLVWDIAKWPILLMIVGLMISVLYLSQAGFGGDLIPSSSWERRVSVDVSTEQVPARAA